MSRGVMTCLPPHDGHPGVEIIWASDCREAFNQGAKLAQSGLIMLVPAGSGQS